MHYEAENEPDCCRDHGAANRMCVTDVRPAQCEHRRLSPNHPHPHCSECGKDLPLPTAAPDPADDLDVHLAEQMTDPVFAAAYRARQAAAPVVPASGELCRNEYPPGKKSREHNPGWHTRIVDCDLPAGHKGDHEETGTGNTWPAAAAPDATTGGAA